MPLTSTDVNWVRRPNASHAASGTSFFDSTTCRYPVPSRRVTNPILPDERVVMTQPRVVTDWPASGGRSSMRWKGGMGSGILVAGGGTVNDGCAVRSARSPPEITAHRVPRTLQSADPEQLEPSLVARDDPLPVRRVLRP